MAKKKKITFKIEINDWDVTQSDRTSKWFKVQNCLFEDPKFYNLSTPAKVLWLYLCTHKAQVRTKSCLLDVNFVSKKCSLRANVVQSSVYELEENQIVTVEFCTGHVPREDKIRKEEIRKDKTRRKAEQSSSKPEPKIDFEQTEIYLAWKAYCPNLAQPSKITEKRKKAIKARLKENSDPIYWMNVATKISESDFCNGHSATGWKADFDWFIKPETHIRVIEGKYDNKENQSNIYGLNSHLMNGDW